MSAEAPPKPTPRVELARAIPKRPRVTWWLTIALAIAFGLVAMPIITADRWSGAVDPSAIRVGEAAGLTVRIPPFAGFITPVGRLGGDGGGVLIARGDIATADDARNARHVAEAMPRGAAPYLAYFAIAAVLAGLFSHHTRRSTSGRLVRVQIINLALIAAAAVLVKLAMLFTAISVLAVPVAVFALLPTLALDRVVGLATGTLTALVMAMLVPFDVGVAILLLVQTSVVGLVVAERPKRRLRATLIAGATATALTALTYPLFQYLTNGHLPWHELAEPLRSSWVAAALGPAIATALALPLVPAYQLLVGEITQGTLIELEDLSQPLLKQIAEKAPGTWQHSLMMANLAEIAANAIGANGRLVRVGAYYHDLGKSLAPKYFIENLEPGETSPHDHLPPEVSCDAIFAHVTEGLVAARRAGLHERIVDFMHMHHGDGVLEYFWAKCQEQGNLKGLTVDDFRYPGVRPQSRETAILAICDAVEAASRTIKKAEPTAIASLVQRIVYGKLHLGQLDESGLSMRDLREVADSLRETIRHANHGRIEYPWQKAEQSASATPSELTTTPGPRLDSLDRPARAQSVRAPTVKAATSEAYAETADLGSQPTTASMKKQPEEPSKPITKPGTGPMQRAHRDLKVSKDGLPRVEHVRPSDGGMRADAVEAIDVEPDTGKHRLDAAKHNSAHEIAQFTVEAHRALDAAARDMDVLPPDDKSAVVRRAIEQAEPSAAVRRKEPSEPPATARKRAATIPPTPSLFRPPTASPTRRAPTVVPAPARGDTSPPPAELRRPSSVRIGESGKQLALIVEDEERKKRESAPPESQPPESQPSKDDAAITQPRMVAAAAVDTRITEPSMPVASDASDDTDVRVDLPLPAPVVSDPAIRLPPAPDASSATWSNGLAARIDKQLDDFGTDTPVSAPSRAELQALLDTPPDATRKLSLDEVELLHRQKELRRSEPQLELTRRAPYPTAEVREEDIESAIEIAPSARRSQSIGIAKTKPKPGES